MKRSDWGQVPYVIQESIVWEEVGDIIDFASNLQVYSYWLSIIQRI